MMVEVILKGIRLGMMTLINGFVDEVKNRKMKYELLYGEGYKVNNRG